jgi:hypothetical protein
LIGLIVVVVCLVESYYEKASERMPQAKSDEINKAIPKLNYEKVDEVFELIDQLKFC